MSPFVLSYGLIATFYMGYMWSHAKIILSRQARTMDLTDSQYFWLNIGAIVTCFVGGLIWPYLIISNYFPKKKGTV